MAVHKWQLRPTKFFGEVCYPLFDVALRASSGKFISFAFQVDSGAVASLMRRSSAELLGLKFDSGRLVDLGGVGGGRTKGYVHDLEVRLDEGLIFRAPFVIAESENVPNLFGRCGVFDKLQIDFDASLTETRITTPWLSAADRTIWELLLETEKHILSRISDSGLQAPATIVVGQFLNRGELLLASAFGLIKLHRAYGGPLFIRAMFELALQFEYLMQDPVVRAQKFLDFAHVTRHQQSRAIVNNPSDLLGRHIASSPMRAAGEARNNTEFNRVKVQFALPNGRISSNWYCMKIAELARSLNWEGEYKVMYSMCCNFAHADPFSMERAMPFDGQDSPIVMLMCIHYYACMLRRVSDDLKIILTHEQYEFLDQFEKSIR